LISCTLLQARYQVVQRAPDRSNGKRAAHRDYDDSTPRNKVVPSQQIIPAIYGETFRHEGSLC
jgi:hypothetical protein